MIGVGDSVPIVPYHRLRRGTKKGAGDPFMALWLACDYRIASKDSVFQMPGPAPPRVTA